MYSKKPKYISFNKDKKIRLFKNMPIIYYENNFYDMLKNHL